MATRILRKRNNFIILNEDLPSIGETIFTYIENKSKALESGRKVAGRGTVTFFRGFGLDLVHKTYKRETNSKINIKCLSLDWIEKNQSAHRV